MNDLSTKYQAGYPGEDSMRSKAERLMRHEMQSMPSERESASSVGREKFRLYKKGGPVKKVHKLNHDQKDLHIPRKSKTPKLNIESFSEAEGMKKGGHKKVSKKHLSEGGEAAMKQGGRYSKGGTVYEREMVGEKPTSKMPHYNYESQMKGTKCIAPSDSMSKGERVLGRGGNPMKKGGKVHHKRHYAIGGSGKVRHGEATAAGKPFVGRKVKMGDWP